MKPLRIALITKFGHEDTGVGRYVQELRQALESAGCQVTVVYPIAPLPNWLMRWVKRLFNLDLTAFFNNYPVWARYPSADIYHLTGQNLATLLLFCRPPGKTVITVHDIIPWLLRKDASLRTYLHSVEALFDWLALKGIARADAVMSDSLFSTDTLLQECPIAEDKISVVTLGVS